MAKAGDILFVIEPSPYEAAVARAEATIAADKAKLQFTALDQPRNTLLLKTRVIAQRDYDQTNTTKDAAAAALLEAQAELKGFVETFDNRIDVNSGTIRARAKFDNKDQTLVPGMFVSVRLANSHEQSRKHRFDRLPDLRASCLPRTFSEIRKSLPPARRDSNSSDVPAIRDLRRLD
jgi:multidrug efflux pump subunit AcrA (membrane-fusion protein)